MILEHWGFIDDRYRFVNSSDFFEFIDWDQEFGRLLNKEEKRDDQKEGKSNIEPVQYPPVLPKLEKEWQPQVWCSITNTEYNWGSGSVGRANNLKKQKIAQGGGEGGFESKEEHRHTNRGRAHINEINELNEYVSEVSSENHPLASPEVSETHPHDWANQKANEVDGCLKT